MNDYIGRYVKRFESGKKGSLNLGQSGYDYGLSCGSYQLTLSNGNCIAFLKHFFPSLASGLYYNSNMEKVRSKKWPGTQYCSSPDAVRAVWMQGYNSVGADVFFEYEHQWIKQSYYDRIKPRVLKLGMDLNACSRAFQELFWSWSVNVGVSGCERKFKAICEKYNISVIPQEQLFDICYDERYSTTSLNRYKKGLMNGSSERETLRLLLKEKGIGVTSITSPSIYKVEPSQKQEVSKLVTYKYYQTNNDCYKKAAPMNPSGIVVHSTAANNPYLKRYVGPNDGRLGENKNKNYWNKPGVKKCMHGFIGKLADGTVTFYNTLPYTYKAWGVATGSRGSFNNSHIQFEICEDNLKNEAYFNEAFDCATTMCAYFCQKFNLSVGSIVSHKEAHDLGYANNHGDPHNWLKNFGKTMDWFRDEVAKKIGNVNVTVIDAIIDEPVKPTEPTEPEEATSYKGIVEVSTSLNVRKGPGTNYSRIGTLANGTVVTISKKSGNWGYVEGKGWVSLNYIKEYTEETKPEYLHKGEVIGGRLNVRARPTMSATRITQLKSGTVIYISKVSEDGKWGYVDSVKGWVHLDYVKYI